MFSKFIHTIYFETLKEFIYQLTKLAVKTLFKVSFQFLKCNKSICKSFSDYSLFVKQMTLT